MTVSERNIRVRMVSYSDVAREQIRHGLPFTAKVMASHTAHYAFILHPELREIF